MRHSRRFVEIAIVMTAVLCVETVAAPQAFAQTVDQLIPHRVKVESTEYLGKRAVKITEDGTVPNGEAYAIVKGPVFHNGAVDVELADCD